MCLWFWAVQLDILEILLPVNQPFLRIFLLNCATIHVE